MKAREIIAFVITAGILFSLSHAHLDPKYNFVYVYGGATVSFFFYIFIAFSDAWEEHRLLQQMFQHRIQEMLNEKDATGEPEKKDEKPVVEHVASLDDK